MSRITRRTFLKTYTTLASSMLLAACTWNNPTLAGTEIEAQLTIWSTPGSIDQTLARWRRINPTINVRRITFESQALALELAQLSSRTSDIPDIVVADNYTIMSQPNLGMWRHLDATTNTQGLLPAAVRHTLIDEQRIVGVPLTTNPLQLWYQSDLMYDTLGIRDPAQMQAAIGDSWTTFDAFIRQMHRSNPMIATMSSCFDDVCLPFALHAMHEQRPLMDGFDAAIRMVQQQIIGRAIHYGGAWFDLLKRNNVAMIFGGRGLVSAITRTWNNELRSPWQTIPHPLGALYGPNLVAAVPIQAPNYERAAQIIHTLAHDIELQIVLSNTSGSVPALAEAYKQPELNQVDPILPQQTIAETWKSQGGQQISILQQQRIMQIQQSKDAFYAWQQEQIDADELRTRLDAIDLMTYL